MFRFALLPLLTAVALVLAACDRAPSSTKPSPPPTVTTYEVKGVLRINKGSSAVIAHEAIPDYMDAMAMEFTAADPKSLAGFAPGDVLAFRLSVTDERSWIDQIRKTGTAPIPSIAAEPDSTPAPNTPLPDCALVDSRGQPFHLSDFRGQVVALTFIFTRCPLPDFCPRMNTQFAEVQRLLAADAATQNWHLLSITLDPDYDTPERLAEYAARYQPDFARWTFATGSREEIEKLGAAVGLQITRAGALPQHNLRTVVVDPAGRVQHVFNGNAWAPEQLATQIRSAMSR
jgi:protein SCO1/2